MKTDKMTEFWISSGISGNIQSTQLLKYAIIWIASWFVSSLFTCLTVQRDVRILHYAFYASTAEERGKGIVKR